MKEFFARFPLMRAELFLFTANYFFFAWDICLVTNDVNWTHWTPFLPSIVLGIVSALIRSYLWHAWEKEKKPRIVVSRPANRRSLKPPRSLPKNRHLRRVA